MQGVSDSDTLCGRLVFETSLISKEHSLSMQKSPERGQGTPARSALAVSGPHVNLVELELYSCNSKDSCWRQLLYFCCKTIVRLTRVESLGSTRWQLLQIHHLQNIQTWPGSKFLAGCNGEEDWIPQSHVLQFELASTMSKPNMYCQPDAI